MRLFKAAPTMHPAASSSPVSGLDEVLETRYATLLAQLTS
jgi:hypothetical protein